ncbi:MAG TPA: hypothetical protein VHU82_04905 [Vicinamibacterales bacterium]|nr:hypothetical protein [Vicinamibacterales bacterium]
MSGCRRRDAPPQIDDEAEAYVRIVLALGDRDPDSLDFYDGPPAWQAQAHARDQSFADIRRSAAALLAQLEHAPATPADGAARRQFLARQLHAVVARVDLLTGHRTSFDDESEALFGVVAPPLDRAGTAQARAAIDPLLPGAGTLTARYAAFDRRFMIPPSRLADVMTRAFAGCRSATLAQMPLPAGEHVIVEYVGGTPWSAFTRYEGHAQSRIRINADFGLTVDRALQLACHEGYPGHHAMNTWIDATLVGPQHRVELTVQPMFSPQSLRTEGAATFAPELAFSDAERLRFERDELFPLAQLDARDAERYLRVERAVDALRMVQADIARRYLDGTLEFARASAALEADALMPSADATLKFFNQFRSYAVTYTLGHDLAARAVDAQSTVDARWRAYEEWVLGTR